jgi:hypothetical protein
VVRHDCASAEILFDNPVALDCVVVDARVQIGSPATVCGDDATEVIR